MKKVLLIEDDKDIIKLLSLHLTWPEYHVTSCMSGTDGIEKMAGNQFHIILLDIMLPDMDGIEVCKQIRNRQFKTAIIMLSARLDEIDKVLALEVGADDYVTKPFGMRELLARIKAHLRRSDEATPVSSEPYKEISFKELVIEKDLRKASLRSKRLDLTPKEFDLLLLLASNPGKTYSRLELLEKVWGYIVSGYEHTVTSHINRLRIKLETDLNKPEYIITSWGIGYRFSDDKEH